MVRPGARRGVAAAVVAVLAFPLAPAGGSGHSVAFQGADCTEYAIFVEVPAGGVRLWVPPQYVIPGEPSGLVTLVVTVAGCAAYTLDGEPLGRGYQNDVGVPIVAPDASPAAHYYHLWHLSTLPELRGAMSDLGMFAALVPGISIERNPIVPPTGLARVEAPVPWAVVGYTLSGYVGPGVDAGPRSAVWWHEGPGGPARLAYTYEPSSLTASAGQLRAEPASALAFLMGGEAATGPTVLRSFDLSAAGAQG